MNAKDKLIEEIPKTVGERLRLWRKWSKWTLVDLHKTIGVSQGSLSDQENNISLPSARTLTLFCLKTDLNICWLLTGIGPVTRNDWQAIDKTARSAQELAQLIDTANAPIFGVDTNGNVNEWNKKVAEITGFSKDEVIGRNLVKTRISEPYRDSVQSFLDNALKGRETSNYEVPLFTKGGKRVMILLNAITRRDVHGQINGVVGVGQDITEFDILRRQNFSILQSAGEGFTV